MNPTDIRNIAIIAHVDHGKTTLVDQLLRQGGAFRDNQVVNDRAMDSMDQERERGITIKAKNTSVRWNDKIINIVDTPGHADFGGEVERVMKMVDGVLLVVDAYEGPQAQTRFVLRKAMAEGLTPIVFVNKVDRPNADPVAVHDKVLELFLDLEANDEQFNAPFLYGSAKDGFATRNVGETSGDLMPLFDAIMEVIPPPNTDPKGDFKILVSNIDWCDYVGRIAIGKVLSGSVTTGDRVWHLRKNGERVRRKVTKVFEFSALAKTDSELGVAGNIIGMSGFDDIDIGETLAAAEDAEAVPFMEIDPPTVQMAFSINDGPFAGLEGDRVTSREIRDRLFREARTNISLKVEDTDTAGIFSVSARGAMQVAVLVETMRREGYEVLVSRPTVIEREIDGRKCEPFETLYVEAPDEAVNGIMKSLANRRATIDAMDTKNSRTTIEATIPTRGLIGFEFELLNLTSGEGILSHLFKEYGPRTGEIRTRNSGTLISMEKGTAMAYSLDTLETRGTLFIGPGEEVYEGMIIGENPRADDLPVNPTKAKHVTNHRSTGDGKGIQLSPPMKFSLERAIEYIGADELLEATPKSLRLRKKILCQHERKRKAKATAA
ncbi:MAG: GTP-binding protein [Verrucomicrobiales bacterium]|jgi:GTP-binding protein